MSEPSGVPTNGAGSCTGSYQAECERLRLLLAEQIDRDALREARETVVALLCLDPNEQDALSARAFLDEQLALAASNPIGEIRRLEGHRSWVNTVAFSPDGRWAISGSGGTGMGGDVKTGEDRSIRLWDVASGRELRRFLGLTSTVTSAVFSADGRYILSGNRCGCMYLWDAGNAVLVRRFERRANVLWSVALSPNGVYTLSAGDDKMIRLWEVKTGRRLRRIQGHKAAVSSVVFSPDGCLGLSGSFDNTVRLWDLWSGREIRRFLGHKLSVLSVAISPDGRQILSGGSETIIRLWDLDTGSEVRRFSGHAAQVNSVAFSADGLRALSGSSDNTIRLWDVATGRELHRFVGHSQPVMSAAFSGDGRYVLSGSRDATVRLWQLPSVMVSPMSPESVSSLADIPYESVATLAEAIRRSRLLEPSQMDELARNLKGHFKDARALALHLLERGWLTTYQLNQITQDSGQDVKLGPFLLLDRLGEGGMGQVYKARRTGSKDVVALKVVRPEFLSNPETVKQFLWEIEALAKLSHPNIIKTFGLHSADNRHFFTMEYIEGTDLAKLVQQCGPLPVWQACDYVRQAALGLEHAHEHCLVHRDIKPANLLLTLPPGQTSVGKGGGQGNEAGGALIKILDWGLAGLRLPAGYKKATPLPREDTVGTADYLSPEQAQDARGADIRSDIYSLGCTLYHLLTGRPPFPGGSLLQKLMKHQKAEPAPVQQLRPGLPEGLPAVLQKMLAKRPDDRYRTPAAVAADLAPFCRAEPCTSKLLDTSTLAAMYIDASQAKQAMAQNQGK